MYWELVKSILTEPMEIIGNPNETSSFKIDIYKYSDRSELRVKVWKLAHFELQLADVTNSNNSTEELFVCEESFGFDSMRESNQDTLIKNVFLKLHTVFKPIESPQ